MTEHSHSALIIQKSAIRIELSFQGYFVVIFLLFHIYIRKSFLESFYKVNSSNVFLIFLFFWPYNALCTSKTFCSTTVIKWSNLTNLFMTAFVGSVPNILLLWGPFLVKKTTNMYPDRTSSISIHWQQIGSLVL